MKCGHCGDKITLAPIGFSGLKDKFCQSCWHKIYTVHSSFRIVEREPNILEFVLKVKE